MENEIKTIGKEYTLPKLIKFVSGPVFTEIAFSLLMTVDDGLFISRYIGFEALAAFSLCSPVFFLKNAITNLLCGSEPHCSILLGEKKDEQACSDFTTTIISGIIIGFLFALIISPFIKPMLVFLGASEITMQYAYPLITMNLWIFPLTITGSIFSRFFVPAGKPQYSMLNTAIMGVANIFFDFLLIARLGLGIYGACITNYISTILIVVFGVIFYSGKNCDIGFSKKLNSHPIKLLFSEAKLGIPGTLTSIALMINTAVINKIILNISDEASLSAYTIVNNIQFVFMSGFFGLDSAVCPMISYAYGEKDSKKLNKVIQQAFALVGILSIIVISCNYVFYKPLTALYLRTGYHEEIKETVYTGLRIAPLAFAFFGFVVMFSDIFIAVGKSKESSIISITENFILANTCVIALTKLIDMYGVWFSFPLQEFLALIVAIIVFNINKHSITNFKKENYED